jgi:hypothetical protein
MTSSAGPTSAMNITDVAPLSCNVYVAKYGSAASCAPIASAWPKETSMRIANGRVARSIASWVRTLADVERRCTTGIRAISRVERSALVITSTPTMTPIRA